MNIDNEVVCGKALDVLGNVSSGSVDMCITSPPYFGLRDYHEDGQIGREPTPEIYVDRLKSVFKDVMRVLKPWGSFYLNIGDTYSGSMGWTKEYANKQQWHPDEPIKRPNTHPKSLLCIPELVMFACIDLGLILRNKIIWKKTNPMPTSTKDRYNTTYEFLYFFVKQKRYYFDLDAIREQHSESSKKRYKAFIEHNESYDSNKHKKADGSQSPMAIFERQVERMGSGDSKRVKTKDLKKFMSMRDAPEPGEPHAFHEKGKNPGDTLSYNTKYRNSSYGQTLQGFVRNNSIEKQRGNSRKIAKDLFPDDKKKQQEYINYVHDHSGHPDGKNPGDIIKENWRGPGDFWAISTESFPDAHFAIFPRQLCRKPIMASCPKKVCDVCGEPRDKRPDFKHQPVYECKDPEFVPGIVMDPFCGSGTALLVARKLGRRYFGIDLNKDYVDMSRKRLAKIPKRLDRFVKK